VSINEQAKNGETALIRATHFNNYQIVEYLLSKGASSELRYDLDKSISLIVV